MLKVTNALNAAETEANALATDDLTIGEVTFICALAGLTSAFRMLRGARTVPARRMVRQRLAAVGCCNSAQGAEMNEMIEQAVALGVGVGQISDAMDELGLPQNAGGGYRLLGGKGGTAFGRAFTLKQIMVEAGGEGVVRHGEAALSLAARRHPRHRRWREH